MDDSEARENITEMIEAGEFDSSDSENDFYDDEADDESEEEDDQDSSSSLSDEDSFEAKYGEPRIEVIEEKL